MGHVASAQSEEFWDDLWFGDDDPDRTEEEAASSLAASVASIVGLKPFPASAWQVMGLLSSANFSVNEIERCIQCDPALAAAVMRVANSMAYTSTSPCKTIHQAIVRLGAQAVRGVVATAATMGLFADVGGLGKTVREHCSGVGGIARTLARRGRYHTPSDAFICGLMHDVGKLLSMQCGEIDYDRFDPLERDRPDSVHRLERQAVGYDHAVLGGHVLKHWGFPAPVPRVVAWHHQTVRAWDEGGDVGFLVAVTHLADAMEHAMRRGEEGDLVFMRLGKLGSASYLDLASVDIEALWAECTEAREETISAL